MLASDTPISRPIVAYMLTIILVTSVLRNRSERSVSYSGWEHTQEARQPHWGSQLCHSLEGFLGKFHSLSLPHVAYFKGLKPCLTHRNRGMHVGPCGQALLGGQRGKGQDFSAGNRRSRAVYTVFNKIFSTCNSSFPRRPFRISLNQGQSSGCPLILPESPVALSPLVQYYIRGGPARVLCLGVFTRLPCVLIWTLSR